MSIKEVTSPQSEAMQNLIRDWVRFLQTYPGWANWNQEKIGQTLFYEEGTKANIPDFEFPSEIEKKHTALLCYLELAQTALALKECEYYFRRYPFRGLPIAHHNHLTNICEMYFGRFYEFRERIKKLEKALTAISPADKKDWGPVIQFVDKVFDREIRARNSAHHHKRFDDIEIEQLFLTKVTFEKDRNPNFRRIHITKYRELTRDWAKRVRNQGKKVDQILDAIAEIVLAQYDLNPQ